MLKELISKNLSKLYHELDYFDKNQLDHLLALELPLNYKGDWKYSNFSHIDFSKVKLSYNNANFQTKIIEELGFEKDDFSYIWFHNGYIIRNNSPVKLSKHKITRSYSYDFFKVLNCTFLNYANKLHINTNTSEELTLYVLYSSDGQNHNLNNSQFIIDLEPQTRLKLIEIFIGNPQKKHINNIYNKFTLYENSKLNHTMIYYHGEHDTYFYENQIEQAQYSTYDSHIITLKGYSNRTKIESLLKGKNAQNNIKILQTPRDQDTHDVFLHIHHLVPETNSKCLAKSVVKNKASSGFTGRIHVYKNASQAKADLQNHNLIIDKKASSNARPELIIEHDNVMCSHGSTIGYIDQEAVFYLLSRGICQVDAEAMLIQAFVMPIIQGISNEKLRNFIKSYLNLQDI